MMGSPVLICPILIDLPYASSVAPTASMASLSLSLGLPILFLPTIILLNLWPIYSTCHNHRSLVSRSFPPSSPTPKVSLVVSFLTFSILVCPVKSVKSSFPPSPSFFPHLLSPLLFPCRIILIPVPSSFCDYISSFD